MTIQQCFVAVAISNLILKNHTINTLVRDFKFYGWMNMINEHPCYNPKCASKYDYQLHELDKITYT